jgi:hypothetical protein
MRINCARAVVLASVFLVPALLHAQQPHRIFGAATVGLGAADPSGAIYLGSLTFSKGLRIGYRLSPRLGTVLELSGQHVSGPGSVPAILCARGLDCSHLFGSLNTTSVGVGLVRLADYSKSSWTLSFTPTWTWYAPQFSTARTNALGFALGGTVAVGPPGHLRPLVQLRYQRGFKDDAMVKQVMEMGIGVSWH